MKVEVAVQGSPSLIVLMVSVDVKHNTETKAQSSGAVCESRWPSWASSPSLTVSPYGLCGRKATLKKKSSSAV